MNSKILNKYKYKFTGGYKDFFEKHYMNGNVHVFEEERDSGGKLFKIKFYWDDGDYTEVLQESIIQNSEAMHNMFIELVEDMAY